MGLITSFSYTPTDASSYALTHTSRSVYDGGGVGWGGVGIITSDIELHCHSVTKYQKVVVFTGGL